MAPILKRAFFLTTGTSLTSTTITEAKMATYSISKKKGFADVLIGAQYGDEGKGRVVDIVAEDEDYAVIARFNGGANAGHTLQLGDKKIALHQVPSGIFNPNRLLYVGSGCVVNPERLVAEINEVHTLDVALDGRLHISSRAALVQPHHILLDKIACGSIGTTGQGIGPAYADRALRIENGRLLHIRVGDLLSSPRQTFQYVLENLEATIKTHAVQGFDVARSMEAFEAGCQAMTPYIQPDTLFMTKLVKAGAKVLFEGAQSAALDIVNGTPPFVTSSNTIARGAFVGGDLPPNFHRKTMAVAKVIMSRVGNGPFISEFGGAASEIYCAENNHAREAERQLDVHELMASGEPLKLGQALRILGGEYGATTGRPRRIGALDLVQLTNIVTANGVDELYLTKCDLLTDFAKRGEGIPLVVGYDLDGASIDYVPAAAEICRRVKPIMVHLPCFNIDISSVRMPDDLPAELLAMIGRIEKMTGSSVKGIGVGPERSAWVKGPFTKDSQLTA